MGERNLMDRIVDQLEVASVPLTCADIRRRLQGNVDRDEVSSRLAKLKARGRLITGTSVSAASSGPREVTTYALAGSDAAKLLEPVPAIAQTQQIGEIASRQVASAAIADDKAA